MLKFDYKIELKEGYYPLQSLELEKEIHIQLLAENTAMAQKMMAKLLEGAPNVAAYSGMCIDEIEK